MLALHFEIDEGQPLPNDALVDSIASDDSPTSDSRQRDKQRRRGRRASASISIESLPVSPNGRRSPEGAGKGMWSSVVSQGRRNDGDGVSTNAQETLLDGRARAASSGGGSSQSQGPLSDAIQIISGNPRVELTKGILHVYRERTDGPVHEKHGAGLRPVLPARRSLMACIVAVPSTMEYRDLLQFLAPVVDTIAHVRVVRDGAPNRYMVLLRFSKQEDADVFYQHYNGRRFSSLEPEVCHVAFVARVEASWSDHFAELPHPQQSSAEGRLVEMPSCPVCLERMDESATGIFTIACNHSIHCKCLSLWGDSSCPICRYRQTTDSNQCMDCETRDDLWICLVCGNIGCGRYRDGHAHSHFRETQHTYAMELDSGRVWDYVGDNYVHRLIQNKGDGKLVELPGPNGARQPAEGTGGFASDEKVDALQLEYTYLLTSQLESQRQYFAAEIDRISLEADCRMREMHEKLEEAHAESNAAKERLVAVEKDKKALEKKYAAVLARATKAEKEHEEDRLLFEEVRKNNELLHKRVEDLTAQFKASMEAKGAEVKELSDQVRDLMFYLETQQKVAASPHRDELQTGQVVIQSEPEETGRRGSIGKGKGKRK